MYIARDMIMLGIALLVACAFITLGAYLMALVIQLLGG